MNKKDTITTLFKYTFLNNTKDLQPTKQQQQIMC